MAELKPSAKCWRTIKGVRWQVWMCDPPRDFVEACKQRRIRVRHIRQSEGAWDLFVHPDDEQDAEHLRIALYPRL